MRRHYALAGIVVAVLVAGLIVVAGTRSTDKTSSAGGTTKGGTMSLPPGHPSIAPTTASQPDYGAMVSALEAKYKKHPGDTRTALALANAYLMNEQTAKASALYAKVLAKDPTNETAKVQYAMTLHASGDDKQALTLIDQVLARNPKSQLGHYNLAILYFSEQKSDLAKSEWQKAAAIDPTTSLGKSAANFVSLMENSTGGPHASSTP